MKDIMEVLKLKTEELEGLTNRLSELTVVNAEMPSLAYAGHEDNRRCGCKGSCDGGCTSW